METKPKLVDIAWMQKFQLVKGGAVYIKSALVKGDTQIGYHSIAGELFFAAKNKKVILVNEEA